MGRKMFGVAAAVVLAGLISGSTAWAKACPALCKQQIKNCKLTTCLTPPKAACKRECKKHFVDECKATASKPKDRTCPTSPSGAFLE